MKIGIIGYGVVGETIAVTLNRKQPNWMIMVYDKFKTHNLWSVALEKLVMEADVTFLCLPTPIKNLETGEPNLTIVESVCQEIALIQNKNAQEKKYTKNIFVLKSTVPPGTTRKLSEKYLGKYIVFVPEFLTEKNRFNDIEDDNLIIGEDEKLGFIANHNDINIVLRALHVNTDRPRCTDLPCGRFVSFEEAELLKYMSNCFLALKVSFANDFYQICQKFKANYNTVKDLTVDASRSRINPSHLNVDPNKGLGYISSCFNKDVLAAIWFFKQQGIQPFTLQAAHDNMMFYRGMNEALQKWGKTLFNPEETKLK